jgi:hypothetical protein
MTTSAQHMRIAVLRHDSAALVRAVCHSTVAMIQQQKRTSL